MRRNQSFGFSCGHKLADDARALMELARILLLIPQTHTHTHTIPIAPRGINRNATSGHDAGKLPRDESSSWLVVSFYPLPAFSVPSLFLPFSPLFCVAPRSQVAINFTF